jgi:hypothetical protein
MMMRGAPYRLLAALVVTIATPAAAASFGELDAWCAPPDQGGKPTLCQGYLASGLELLASPDKSLNDGLRACVPEEDRGKVVSLLRAYARSHPAARSLDGVDGLGLVLKERYPCR